MKQTLRKKYPYLEIFWSVFYRIRTENGEMLCIRMHENTDQNNSKYGHFSRSECSAAIILEKNLHIFDE